MTELPEDVGLNTAWKTQPELIKAYLDIRPAYEQLAAEVAYILEKRVRASGFEIASVTWRAKTLHSFIEKIARKHYKSPLEEMTDLAGVRLVHLYASDSAEIEKILRAEFVVIDHVDKREEQGPDHFGYTAVHFVVRLGEGSSGARYEDVKDLTCEIQVRTILQDAWAIIDHHLAYKQESAVPPPVLRRLNRLVAIFEDADEKFDAIRAERLEYIKKLRPAAHSVDLFAQDINQDSLVAYLGSRFPPNRETHPLPATTFLDHIDRKKYTTVGALDDLLRRTLAMRSDYYRRLKLRGENLHSFDLMVALAFENPEVRQSVFAPKAAALIESIATQSSAKHNE
jgi:putative GTP pyrophosphokinase